jgi:hypothetical protein
MLDKVGRQDKQIESSLETLPLELDLHELISYGAYYYLEFLHLIGVLCQIAHLPYGHHFVSVAYYVVYQLLPL